MSQVTGTVEKIMTRPTSTGGTAYNVNVGGEWYGHGFNAPKFVEGDSISFSFQSQGKFKNMQPHSVAVVAAPAAAPASGGGGGSRPNNTQLAIQYQASRNAALHFLEVAVAAGAVPLPTKKSDQYEALLAVVDDVTNQFHVKTSEVVENGGVYPSGLDSARAQEDF